MVRRQMVFSMLLFVAAALVTGWTIDQHYAGGFDTDEGPLAHNWPQVPVTRN